MLHNYAIELRLFSQESNAGVTIWDHFAKIFPDYFDKDHGIKLACYMENIFGVASPQRSVVFSSKTEEGSNSTSTKTGIQKIVEDAVQQFQAFKESDRYSPSEFGDLNDIIKDVSGPAGIKFHKVPTLLSAINNNDNAAIFTPALKAYIRKLREDLELFDKLENYVSLFVSYLAKYHANYKVTNTGMCSLEKLKEVEIFFQYFMENALNNLFVCFGQPIYDDLIVAFYLGQLKHKALCVIDPELVKMDEQQPTYDADSIYKIDLDLLVADEHKQITLQPPSATNSARLDTLPMERLSEKEQSIPNLVKSLFDAVRFEIEHSKVNSSACCDYEVCFDDIDMTKENLEAKLREHDYLFHVYQAAYEYYDHVKPNTHGSRCAKLFLHKLLISENPTEMDIKAETLRFVKGEGEYGTWYGGSSRWDLNSRIRFILDANIFSQEDIVQHRLDGVTSVIQGFFSPKRNSQQNFFADMSRDERRQLTVGFKKLHLRCSQE